MIKMLVNGADIRVEPGTTLLEAARQGGATIPTLCYDQALSPYGACRLCLVEIGAPGKSSLVSACTYPAREGLVVATDTQRVIKARKLLIELYLATCPSSKTLQDLASSYGVSEVRYTLKHEDCILCGLCVRVCEEQMQAKAIGFINRGINRRIGTPFDKQSDQCRLCGACMYICPVCMARCQGPQAEEALCNACLNTVPNLVDLPAGNEG